jgi:hypothetical protein
MTVQFTSRDSRIIALAGKAENIESEDDLIEALKECGYTIPASFNQRFVFLYFQQSQGKPSTASAPRTV